MESKQYRENTFPRMAELNEGCTARHKLPRWKCAFPGTDEMKGKHTPRKRKGVWCYDRHRGKRSVRRGPEGGKIGTGERSLAKNLFRKVSHKEHAELWRVVTDEKRDLRSARNEEIQSGTLHRRSSYTQEKAGETRRSDLRHWGKSRNGESGFPQVGSTLRRST